MDHVVCPRCKDFVDIMEDRGAFECPICSLRGHWEEYWTEDYSYWWKTPVWESEE